MKCLVTGCSGFIGSHLSDRLLKEGHEVIGIDNFVTGKKENIAHLSGNKHFSFIEHDVIDPLPESVHSDIIFHFASPASPPKYQQIPVKTLLVNTQGTYNLLKSAVSQSSRFIFASSSEIYGEPKQHPQKESYFGNVNPIGPRSCYDEGKRCGESFVFAFMKNHGIDGRILRIFNTYGSRMDLDDGRVVTNFIKQIRAKKPLELYGKGAQTRSFCYVSDLVEGVFKVAFSDHASGEVFNLGNPTEITIKELAALIQKIAHTNTGTIDKPLPPDDPTRRKPDITKAKTLLEWQPTVSLAEGLKQTIASFQ